jgi:periplasmic protein TonB
MKRLNDQRITEFKNYLRESGLGEALLPELLDHLACEAEERLWEGQSLEQVVEALQNEVDPDTLKQLGLEHKHLLAVEESLNDIVFENRNKLYGAYALRREYGGHVQRATIIGVGIFVLLFCLPELYARLNPEPENDAIVFEVEFNPITIKPEQLPTLPPAEQAPSPATVKTVRDLPPLVLPDEQVLVEHLPPTVEMLENVQPDRETVEGVDNKEIVVPPAEFAGRGGVVETRIEPEQELIFAEQQPEYYGGAEAFGQFLRKNLKYPTAAARAGVQGKVFVEFTVGTDGRIERARTIKGIGFGCDEEALRVVNLMPDWKPGKQSGIPVRVRYTLPIAFQLE